MVHCEVHCEITNRYGHVLCMCACMRACVCVCVCACVCAYVSAWWACVGVSAHVCVWAVGYARKCMRISSTAKSSVCEKSGVNVKNASVTYPILAPIGSSAKVVCNQGYMLQDSNEFICGHNNNTKMVVWSWYGTATCIRKFERILRAYRSLVSHHKEKPFATISCRWSTRRITA